MSSSNVLLGLSYNTSCKTLRSWQLCVYKF